MRQTIIGVMGGTSASPETEAHAHAIGRLIAENGWLLLNGGRPTGVMGASAKGCREAGGTSIGILFDGEREAACEHLDIVIPTGMGAARNVANILASDVVVACQGQGGTLSEIALALRFNRPCVLLDFDPGAAFLDACGQGRWFLAKTPEEAADLVRQQLEEMGRA